MKTYFQQLIYDIHDNFTKDLDQNLKNVLESYASILEESDPVRLKNMVKYTKKEKETYFKYSTDVHKETNLGMLEKDTQAIFKNHFERKIEHSKLSPLEFYQFCNQEPLEEMLCNHKQAIGDSLLTSRISGKTVAIAESKFRPSLSFKMEDIKTLKMVSADHILVSNEKEFTIQTYKKQKNPFESDF